MLLGGGLLLTPLPNAQAAEGSANSQSISVPLEYREAETDLITLGLSIETQSNAFSKEPALSGRDLRRGTFTFGNTEGSGFIWDQEQGQLYLDLNRNADLSDDPDGRFSCSIAAQSDIYQQFENVRLEFPINGVSQRMRFKLSLYNFGQLGGSIALRSYWSGKAVLQGREWELGVVPLVYGQGRPGEDDVLLLRPWTAVGTGFSVGDGSLDTFACGSNLFFQGQAYDVQRKVSPEAPLPFAIDLAARETELGEVRFTAQHLRRALLADGPWTVVIDEPSGSVAVPQATYGTHMVHVRQGETEARLAQAWIGSGGVSKPTVVQAGAPATVTAGGPLTNSVTIQRRGHSLVLNYQLIGAGGESYRPPSQSPGQPPRFAIYLGERLLESGDFEFG